MLMRSGKALKFTLHLSLLHTILRQFRISRAIIGAPLTCPLNLRCYHCTTPADSTFGSLPDPFRYTWTDTTTRIPRIRHSLTKLCTTQHTIRIRPPHSCSYRPFSKELLIPPTSPRTTNMCTAFATRITHRPSSRRPRELRHKKPRNHTLWN